MKTQLFIQDYYGSKNFVDLYKDKNLTIFIVDDNKVYLQLLKFSLKRENFNILTFSSGEECLLYLELKPDLVILDYHLDSANPYAKKGNEISKIIREELPETEIVLISSDNQFEVISNMNLSTKILFKNDFLISNLQKSIRVISLKLLINKNSKLHKKTLYIAAFIVITTTTSLLYTFI